MAELAGPDTRRLQWASHVSRMDSHRWPVKMLDFVLHGEDFTLDSPIQRWSDGFRNGLSRSGLGFTTGGGGQKTESGGAGFAHVK